MIREFKVPVGAGAAFQEQARHLNELVRALNALMGPRGDGLVRVRTGTDGRAVFGVNLDLLRARVPHTVLTDDGTNVTYGVIPITSEDSSVVVTVTDGPDGAVDLSAPGPGQYVTSINGAWGEVTLTSTDESVTIADTPGEDGNIDLSVTLLALADEAPPDVAATGAVGDSAEAARENHTHRGVTSINDMEIQTPERYGDIIFSATTPVSITNPSDGNNQRFDLSLTGAITRAALLAGHANGDGGWGQVAGPDADKAKRLQSNGSTYIEWNYPVAKTNAGKWAACPTNGWYIMT